jgi:hypothetical protein
MHFVLNGLETYCGYDRRLIADVSMHFVLNGLETQMTAYHQPQPDMFQCTSC